MVSAPIDPAAATAAYGHYAEEAPRPTTPKPHIPICDRDLSCMPVERTFGESVKIGVGKLWGGIQRGLGPSEPVESTIPTIGAPRA